MFFDSRVKHESGLHMVYASMGSMWCFERGAISHKRLTCPHVKQKKGDTYVGPELEVTAEATRNCSSASVEVSEAEAAPFAEPEK